MSEKDVHDLGDSPQEEETNERPDVKSATTEEWMDYIYENEQPNCKGMSLADMSFSDTRLGFMQWDISSNYGAHDYLEGANLEDANLSGCGLEGVVLRDTNCKGANFQNANLEGADFQGADLRGANLDGALLEGAIFWGANLDGHDLDDLRERVAGF
jgi:uncharacterized protein YjbI with pentapeptide repeats